MRFWHKAWNQSQWEHLFPLESFWRIHLRRRRIFRRLTDFRYQAFLNCLFLTSCIVSLHHQVKPPLSFSVSWCCQSSLVGGPPPLRRPPGQAAVIGPLIGDKSDAKRRRANKQPSDGCMKWCIPEWTGEGTETKTRRRRWHKWEMSGRRMNEWRG